MIETPEDGGVATRWGMVVDLNRCVGCQTCTIACKHANDTPPGVQWRRVLDVERGTFPDVERLFLVTGCQHCAEPPCVPVCPTGATAQRADGLVTMDYDTCIGCGNCAGNCPYDNIRMVEIRDGEGNFVVDATSDTPIAKATKCDLCIDQPGGPACQRACPHDALVRIDMSDAPSLASWLNR